MSSIPPAPTSDPDDAAPPRAAGWRRARQLRRQLLGRSPFAGTISPTRVRLLAPGSGRPTLPFPHPWNYRRPLRILDTFFWGADKEDAPGRHSRYLEVPGFAPVLVTRDPGVIRAISSETGDKPGMFDRDTLPSAGIARATGADTLLYANGPLWKRQKKLATPAFARTSLFQPDQFHQFEHTFRHTARERLELVRRRISGGEGAIRVELEPEIKAIMLEMLVNNFFGADVPYQEIRDVYVPGIERVIDHIVRDTVINKLGISLERMPPVTRGIREAKIARATFERLTDIVIATRKDCKGQWGQFKSEAPDDALRSNIRVFLAGALEATTSYASWAISHLARNPAAQDRVQQEVGVIDDYSPETLERAVYLGHVLNETLRLTPSLYFHPRRASADTWVETAEGDKLFIPCGTHILLDIWHANRHEDHWGVEKTGFPADRFVPERWERFASEGRGPNEMLHFGFGHGPRFCPGKSLGQLEVALVVGACVKLFRLSAVNPTGEARAGVSTKPLDGVLVDLRLQDGSPRSSRDGASDAAQEGGPARDKPGAGPSSCPFSKGARPA